MESARLLAWRSRSEYVGLLLVLLVLTSSCADPAPSPPRTPDAQQSAYIQQTTELLNVISDSLRILSDAWGYLPHPSGAEGDFEALDERNDLLFRLSYLQDRFYTLSAQMQTASAASEKVRWRYEELQRRMRRLEQQWNAEREALLAEVRAMRESQQQQQRQMTALLMQQENTLRELQSTRRTIQRQRAAQAQTYFVVDTWQGLERRGLIERKKRLGKDRLTPLAPFASRAFSEATRETTRIPLGSGPLREVRILYPLPNPRFNRTWSLRRRGGQSEIAITDPGGFWASDYVLIMIRP